MLWNRNNDKWEHDCPEKSERLVLSREQMGIYNVDKQNRELNTDTGKWVYDDPPGCIWCGDLPVELRAVVTIVDKRKRKKA